MENGIGSSRRSTAVWLVFLPRLCGGETKIRLEMSPAGLRKIWPRTAHKNQPTTAPTTTNVGCIVWKLESKPQWQRQ